MIVIGALLLFAGDFFRKLWGSYAGWAHSVSKKKTFSALCCAFINVYLYHETVLALHCMFIFLICFILLNTLCCLYVCVCVYRWIGR